MLDHKRHIPQLDGLRGVAILLILFHHTGLDAQYSTAWHPTTYGWIGVDLFFVLSGFLITGILLDTRGSDTWGSSSYFTSFYVRRGLRIWPLYYLVLLFALVAVPALSSGVRSLLVGIPRWPYWIYVQNFVVRGYGREGLGPTWSLCIEEQFYLVWPVVLFFFSRSRLKLLLVFIFLLSPILRHFLFLATQDWQMVYRNSFCHLDALAAGALVALVLREPAGALRSTTNWMRGIAVGGALVGIPLLVARDRGSSLVYSFLAVSFGGLLGATVLLQEGAGWNRFLRIRFLQYCGKISYGLYLINLFTYHASQWLMRQMAVRRSFISEAIFAVVSNAIVFALAGFSWRFFEKPILSLKQKFQYREPATRMAAAAQ